MVHYNISFLGAGRVAGAFCTEMYKAGIKIQQIVSENKSSGKPLADLCNAKWSSDLNFNNLNDIIIVAVPDRNLANLLSLIKCHEKSIVAHTAGSYGLEVFPARLVKTGVFYPLQTFSKGRNIQFRDMPILLEANSADTGDILKGFAEQLGCKAYYADNERRRLLHIAAIFVNNFTNYMLTGGNEIALKAGFSFEIFEPLLKETISKALENGPEASQTGPAVRNDLNTIEKHIELLSFSPDLQKLYIELTKSITEHYK